MTTLLGQGFGATPIIGRAARLDVESGRALLDETLLTTIARWRVREGVDLGLVLVAEDALMALLLPLPSGAFLAGVIAQRPLVVAPALPPGVVVIAGVEDALLAVAEGEMVLLDPAQGTVLVTPLAQVVAQLQTRHRPRVLLGEAHAQAFTQSGRLVTVWGLAHSLNDAEQAMAQGADGLLLEGVWDETALERAATAVGGGELALLASLDAVDPEVVVTLAARSVLRWCLFPEDLPTSAADLRAELEALIAELRDQNTPAVLPQLFAVETAAPGFDGLLVLSGELPPPDPEVLPWDRLPFYVRVAELFGEIRDLEPAIDAGATGVIADPHTVSAIKERIRTLD